jgi:hypothetical protein
MRSFIIIVAAGLALGSLPITALESALPQTAIPYNGEALRTAITDGMSRAGATPVRADGGAPEVRH